jgi:hypothetical protein
MQNTRNTKDFNPYNFKDDPLSIFKTLGRLSITKVTEVYICFLALISIPVAGSNKKQNITFDTAIYVFVFPPHGPF